MRDLGARPWKRSGATVRLDLHVVCPLLFAMLVAGIAEGPGGLLANSPAVMLILLACWLVLAYACVVAYLVATVRRPAWIAAAKQYLEKLGRTV